MKLLELLEEFKTCLKTNRDDAFRGLQDDLNYYVDLNDKDLVGTTVDTVGKLTELYFTTFNFERLVQSDKDLIICGMFKEIATESILKILEVLNYEN